MSRRSDQPFQIPGRAAWYAWQYVDGQWLRKSTKTKRIKTARKIAARWSEQGEREEKGLASPAERRMLEPLDRHLAEFEQWMRTKPAKVTVKHVADTMAMLERAAAGCGWLRLADISEQSVLHYLSMLPVTGETKNRHRAAINTFVRWCVRTRRLLSNPITDVGRYDADEDPQAQRRPLAVDEVDKLLAATKAGPVRGGMSGMERWALYTVALGTGFRRGELASLTTHSMHLDEDPPFIVLMKTASKGKVKTVEQPIPRSVAKQIKPFLESREAGERVWQKLATARTARMLHDDMKAAGLNTADEQGRVADFHALRHTYITNLTLAEVHPKTAQELARHSTIDLTMRYYTHLSMRDIAAAVERAAPSAARNDVTEAYRLAVGGPEAPPPDEPKPSKTREKTPMRLSGDNGPGECDSDFKSAASANSATGPCASLRRRGER